MANLPAELREDLRRALEAGAARTPLDPPGGAAWLVLWAWSCLLAGLILFLACGYTAGFARVNGWAAGYPDWLWQWLTVLGDDRVPFALSLFIARHRPRIFWALILGALFAVAFARGLKPLLDLPRPAAVLALEQIHLIGRALHRTSFPSGHSVVAGLFFGALVYYGRGWMLRAIWVSTALLVGLSRVAVGAHWPVDVAFGLLGGVLSAWAGGRLAARWPGPAVVPSLHLAGVTLASLAALSLAYRDERYALARPLLYLLGLGAPVYAIGVYLLWPLAGCLRRTDPSPPPA